MVPDTAREDAADRLGRRVDGEGCRRCEREDDCEMTAFPRGTFRDLDGCDHGGPPQDVWHRYLPRYPSGQTSEFCNRRPLQIYSLALSRITFWEHDPAVSS